MAAKQHWLVKQEPDAYAWAEFMRDGGTDWTGVRNFQARNNLRAMRVGDAVLFYASGAEKAAVGLARVRRAAFPDPTAEPGAGDWVAVELEPVRALARPVTLGLLKAEPALAQMALLRQSRLSVVPLTAAEFARILELGGCAGQPLPPGCGGERQLDPEPRRPMLRPCFTTLRTAVRGGRRSPCLRS